MIIRAERERDADAGSADRENKRPKVGQISHRNSHSKEDNKKFSRFEPLSKFSHFYKFRFPAMKTRPRKRGRLTAKATRGLEQLRTNTV